MSGERSTEMVPWRALVYRDRSGDLWELGSHDRWYRGGDALSSRSFDTLLRLNGPLTPAVSTPPTQEATS